MILWGIFTFEFRYQVRRAWPWLIFAVLVVLSFFMARDASLADALYEDLFINSPFSLAKTTVVGTLVWLLGAGAVAGEAGARDVATRMYPLFYTSHVSKAQYLGGRFLAALAINALLLIGVQLGAMLGIYAPGLDPAIIGPFRPAAYITSYLYISVANALFATVIQFSLAALIGRPMAAYMGSLLLVFMGFFVASLLLFRQGLGTLLDPIGIRFIIEDVAYLWTTIEKCDRLLGLEGVVLSNRLTWLAISVVTLALSYARFRFAHRTETSWRSRRRRAVIQEAPLDRTAAATRARTSLGSVPRSFGALIDARKALAIGWASFKSLSTSWAGLGLLIPVPLLTVLVVIDQMMAFSLPLVPTTARVIAELTGPLTAELSRWVIIPALLVFFAGELVWRERESHLAEINDAMPQSDWAPFAGKLLGLTLLLGAFTTLQMGAGMLAQVMMGYQNFELPLYLKILFGLQLPEYVLFAVLALAVHAVVDQKYIGHLVGIMMYVFIAVLAGMFGIEHNLLVYGGGPQWSYTEMRGFAGFTGPWLWFKAYWAAWALLLAVVATLFWSRGREAEFGTRLRMAGRRFAGSTRWVAGLAGALIVTLGSFIFYNTNVLNEYRGSKDVAEVRAEYERRYRRYEDMPQPRITGASVRVEMHPSHQVVDISGSYRLVSEHDGAIGSIHVATSPAGVETGEVTFDRPASLRVDDAGHGYRIYELDTPLERGDTLRMSFQVHAAQRGFGNRGISPALVKRGSSFTSGAWFPFVGYQRQRELLAPSQRREHGLEPRAVLSSLYETEGREPARRGGGIAFEAVVGTDADQVAVAPGGLRRTWTENGRRYFHYVTDAPIGNEWSFYSANYAVQIGKVNDVDIRIYHYPSHTGHLEGVMRGAKESLEYFGAQFGAYPYKHLTVVEHPGAPGTGMHADASMISYGEGWPYWIVDKDRPSLDFPYAVMAHEMAHQWTLPYALVEGLPFLAEGLAWYSAIQLIRNARDEEQLRRLMSFMRSPYPHKPIRRGEPLLRAMDPYMAYRRGPFAMYALSEYLGADRVNGTIRRLTEKHDAPGAPPVTTLDLYRELQAVTPDSLRYLLHDLFEVNTYWQLATEKVSATQNADSTWEVTLDVNARKVVFDSAGVQAERAMDEWVPVGVFGEAAEGTHELSASLYLQMHRVRTGRQTITVTVPRKPALAGIDPHHLLDWEEGDDDDNIEQVQIERPVDPSPRK